MPKIAVYTIIMSDTKIIYNSSFIILINYMWPMYYRRKYYMFMGTRES
jgi:hypothetical protein